MQYLSFIFKLSFLWTDITCKGSGLPSAHFYQGISLCNGGSISKGEECAQDQGYHYSQTLDKGEHIWLGDAQGGNIALPQAVDGLMQARGGKNIHIYTIL